MTTTPYPLGRRIENDPKNAEFPMSAVLPEAIVLPSSRYWYAYRVHLNQTGDTCVANAWTHFLSDSPKTHRLYDLDSDRPGWKIDAGGAGLVYYRSPQSGEVAFRGWLYDQAQATDPWDDTPPNGGTSVEAAARILRSLGAIGSFHWATTMDDIVTAVLSTSPVIVGTNWYQDMFYPKGSGTMLQVSGALAGGHAWKVDGYNQSTEIFRMKNSWGASWGDNGFAHITRADLQRLIFQDDGQACLALE